MARRINQLVERAGQEIGGAALIILGSGLLNRGDKFQYTAVSGDPLELGRLGHGFKANFKTDKEWFEKTAGHRYPDAVANVYKSVFTPRVKHTADVLLNIKDGFYYGSSPFGRLVRLRATHGNAMQASSNAFLMSTHRHFPAFVRADDAKALSRG